MEKPIGNIRSMTFKLEDPPLNIDEMELREIMILVGSNGSGKSLVLKFNWALAMITHSTIGARKMGAPITVNETAQFVLDNTFVDQNFTGKVECFFENGTTSVELKDGKVTSAGVDLDPGVNSCPTPIFMSTDLRTFEQIKQFLKMEKMAGGDKEKMLESYRLYDITYIESLKMKLSGGLTLPSAFRDIMKNYELDKYDFREFFIEDETVKFKNGEGKARDLATLSKGEQSLVNMFLVNNW